MYDFNADFLLLSVHYNPNQGPRIHESKEFAQSRIQKLQEMSGMTVSLLFCGVLGCLVKVNQCHTSRTANQDVLFRSENHLIAQTAEKTCFVFVEHTSDPSKQKHFSQISEMSKEPRPVSRDCIYPALVGCAAPVEVVLPQISSNMW